MMTTLGNIAGIVVVGSCLVAMLCLLSLLVKFTLDRWRGR
jgi:hypothetical protein